MNAATRHDRAALGPSPVFGLLGPRAIALWALRTMTDGVTIEGIEHVPASGPALLVARHYHHLLDGAVLTHYLRREPHIVVGLDWAADAAQRRWMERACRLARYPVILRPQTTGAAGAYDRAEVGTYLRRGLRDAASLLAEGRPVLVFPEGYPAVDPAAPDAAAGRDADGFLPFQSGFLAIARLAARAGVRPPLVPVGFAYERGARGRWRIRARIGAPLPGDTGADEAERTVRQLSR